jgi:hypothetical protein
LQRPGARCIRCAILPSSGVLVDAAARPFLLTLIHNGAAPLDRRDHRAYYNYITVWLDESPLLTPRALADLIKEVQGKLLRRSVEA